MVAILKSPPPCLGSASDSSSRMVASIFAKSYREGNVGKQGMAIPFSSTDTASGNRYSNGAHNLFVHSFKKAVCSADKPVDVPSIACCPCNVIHSTDENTAIVNEDDTDAEPAPRVVVPEL